MNRYTGSCHCGAVQFAVELPDAVTVQDCNCSICSKAGFLHLIVPRAKFTLLQGADNITTYTFNTGVAKHTFCKTCGITTRLTCAEHLRAGTGADDFDAVLTILSGPTASASVSNSAA